MMIETLPTDRLLSSFDKRAQEPSVESGNVSPEDGVALASHTSRQRRRSDWSPLCRPTDLAAHASNQRVVA